MRRSTPSPCSRSCAGATSPQHRLKNIFSRVRRIDQTLGGAPRGTWARRRAPVGGAPPCFPIPLIDWLASRPLHHRLFVRLGLAKCAPWLFEASGVRHGSYRPQERGPPAEHRARSVQLGSYGFCRNPRFSVPKRPHTVMAVRPKAGDDRRGSNHDARSSARRAEKPNWEERSWHCRERSAGGSGSRAPAAGADRDCAENAAKTQLADSRFRNWEHEGCERAGRITPSRWAMRRARVSLSAWRLGSLSVRSECRDLSHELVRGAAPSLRARRFRTMLGSERCRSPKRGGERGLPRPAGAARVAPRCAASLRRTGSLSRFYTPHRRARRSRSGPEKRCRTPAESEPHGSGVSWGPWSRLPRGLWVASREDLPHIFGF